MNKLFKLIDNFVNNWQGSPLAIEWRELDADGAPIQRYIEAIQVFEHTLTPEQKAAVSEIQRAQDTD